MHGEEISQIACGGYHTIILKANHDVLVFGCNENGQLGLGHNNTQNKPQLLMRGEKIHQIACGDGNTVILKANNDVIVFGNNVYGQLGLGHNNSQASPQLLMQGEKINQIACGRYHTIILRANPAGLGSAGSSPICPFREKVPEGHDVLVFGRNGYGQLGLGHNEDQNKPQLLSIKATLLSGILIYPEWSPEYHSVFLPHFRVGIYTFLLVHKRLSLCTRIKIPKFVLFEIFKRCAKN
jgi:alpha-tubulin suppressor-like RCC1 family protein